MTFGQEEPSGAWNPAIRRGRVLLMFSSERSREGAFVLTMVYGPIVLAVTLIFLGGYEALLSALALVVLGIVGGIAAVVADAARKKGRNFSTFFCFRIW